MSDLYVNKYHVNASFNKYKGDHVTVFDDDRLFDDVRNFYSDLNVNKEI